VWKFEGPPENPSGWLTTAAKNRAIDIIRRDNRFREFAPDLALQLKSEWSLVATVQKVFLESEIADDQLRLMFLCCDPELSETSQVQLILKTLGGLHVKEIARAFLISDSAVERRLSRARSRLKARGELIAVDDSEAIRKRLDAVRRAVYLIFNEGYHSTHPERSVRQELCDEAIRLGRLLVDHPATGEPETIALLSLICLHAARLPSRTNDAGQLLPLAEQDRSRWNTKLGMEGFRLLDRAASGEKLTAFHIEAAIAACHTGAPTFEATNWALVTQQYDLLLRVRNSPVVALNRAIALGHAEGPQAGLDAIDELPADQLRDYPFFHAARAQFHERLGQLAEALQHLDHATSCARNEPEIAYYAALRERWMASGS